MASRRKKTLIFLLSIFIILLTNCWIFDVFDTNYGKHLKPVSERNKGIKYNISCEFPDFDPFHPKSMSYYKEYPTTKCPDGKPTITFYNGEMVKVNQTHKQKTLGEQKIQCWYRSVAYRRRVIFVNGEWKGPFTDSIEVPERPEFVEVTCNNEKGKEVSKMHHYIVRKEERKKSKPPKQKEFPSERMNVILLGVDSLSRHLLERAMPKSRNYLLQQLGAVQLMIYNRVGDKTFPNLLALFTGQYKREINWSGAASFDKLPFLWKQFRSQGYRTQYMSDRPDFSNFDVPPTDSFNLPMANALSKNLPDVFENDCFEDQIELKLWLNLVIEFARESLFTIGRFFSLGMLSCPTHDIPNQASGVDEHYQHFFQEVNDTGLLNNTFMVFFGDHGPRIHNYRHTFQGSIEERAASMIIYVPPWFKAKYPAHFRNLKINAERLTTNFDVHETVLNLLTLPAQSSKNKNPVLSTTGKPRAISLFSEISPKRTCEDAGVTPHMCMCYGGVSVVDSKIRRDVGLQVVKDINNLLQPKSDLCATLRLINVTSLAVLEGQVGRTALFRVMLETEPGGAMFEATVKYDVFLYFFVTKIETLGLISRINMYRGQSDCVNDDLVARMYCYCKDVLEKTKKGD